MVVRRRVAVPIARRKRLSQSDHLYRPLRTGVMAQAAAEAVAGRLSLAKDDLAGDDGA